MNGMNFNERARFVYTRLLPLLQTATGGAVEGLTYEACGDDIDPFDERYAEKNLYLWLRDEEENNA